MKLTLTGPTFSKDYLVKKPVISIGRDSSCDWPILFDKLSKVHCEIHYDINTQKIAIIDKNSKNGIRIDGERIDPGKMIFITSRSTILLANELILSFELTSNESAQEKLYSLAPRERTYKEIKITEKKTPKKEPKKNYIILIASATIAIIIIFFLLKK